MTRYQEWNFDGLVGPTHNYAGLGSGNLASQASRSQTSRPRDAALEGLAKMKKVAELGVPQAILPPQRRPHLGYLRSCGYGDTPAELLKNAADNREAGARDLAIASSASAMWAANAATVSPSPDTRDGRCHFTIANLVSNRHRALESYERLRVFQHLFADEKHFAVHPPLPATMPDEGAANHTRLARFYHEVGLEIFVYGRQLGQTRVGKFPPRQLLEASQQIAEQHGLSFSNTLFIEQSDAARDAGVFHNDVISVGNEYALLTHELAFRDPSALDQIREAAQQRVSVLDLPQHVMVVSEEELPTDDAVRTYLFNSQLLSLPEGGMALIYPAECDESEAAKAVINRLLRENSPIDKAMVAGVRQSMKDGGGPACRRLRVLLSDAEKQAVRGNVFWTPELHETLTRWVERHYREQLTPDDLGDVALYEESEAALDELRDILDLPVI